MSLNNKSLIGLGIGMTMLSISMISSVLHSSPNSKKTFIDKYKEKSCIEIKKIVDSPKEAYNYITSVYGKNSFCVDTARLGSYLIFDDNYSSMPLLFVKDKGCHCVCMFKDKKSNNYGFFDNGIWGYQKAKFHFVQEVVDYIKNEKGFYLMPFSKNSLVKDEDYSSKEGLESLIRILNNDKK